MGMVLQQRVHGLQKCLRRTFLVYKPRILWLCTSQNLVARAIPVRGLRLGIGSGEAESRSA